jgi:outer membrane protein assembly factor BamB/serine/threonine protein kinase/FKBP-type peptidyl-prolyl cis-trans isomerase 2
MDDAGEGSRATRRQVLGATAGALAVGALPGRTGAQQASGPTVYVGSGDGNVYALDAGTGEGVWSFETGTAVVSSPTVVDGTVYVGSNDGNVYALDAGTGEEVWAFGTGDWVESSPTVVDGTVYVGSWDNSVYALDAGTGQQVWEFDTGKFDWSSPTVVDGTVYVGSGDGDVHALDASTGEQVWAFETNDSVYSSPTVASGTVYVGSDDASVYALDATSGEEAWTFDTGDVIDTSSPTVTDGTVYIGTRYGEVYAIDTETGEKVWDFQTDGRIFSSPTVFKDKLFIGSDDTYLYALDTSSGERVWKYQTDERIYQSSPTVSENIVFVGNLSNSGNINFYALDANTGNKNWTNEIVGTVISSPTVVMDPESGDSVGSRVLLGTLGHHGERADRVTGPSPASFAVTIEETAETQMGEPLNVTVAVENTGGITDTQSIELSIPGLGNDSTEVSLDGGESTTETFSLSTGEGDSGEYTATVSTDDDSAQETVTVLAPAMFTVDIVETTDPVEGGSLDVTVDVENTGNAGGMRTVALSVPSLGSNSVEVDLDGGGSTTETLSILTEAGDAGEYDATVEAGDSSDSTEVTVLAPAAFTVDIEETTTPVEGGTLGVTVAVENTGDSSGTRTVELSVPGLGSDSREVSLDGGDSTTETLSILTETGDAGEYTVTVETGNSSDSADVTVLAPAAFTVDITGTNNPVAGDPLEVTVAVENIGDEAGSQTVELSAPGLGSDSVGVDLDGGSSTIEELSLSTGNGDAGEYTVTVETGNSSDSTDVTVFAPAAFTVEITDTNDPVAGDRLEVTVAVENTGEEAGSQTVELSAPGLGSDSVEVEELDGDESTTEMLSLSTDEEDAGEYTVTAQAGDAEATETVTVSEPAGDGSTGSPDDSSGSGDDDSTSGDGGTGSPGDGTTSGDDSTDSPGDDSTPDDDQSTTDSTDDGNSTGDGGLGTTEMAAVGGGGGLALLLGAYALMRRSGDDDSDSTPDASTSGESSGQPSPSPSPSPTPDRDATRQRGRSDAGGVPLRIPDTPRPSLSYEDITLGDPLGRGGNADVYYATAATPQGDLELAAKEPRMGGGETLNTEVVERMMTEAETWQQLDDHDHVAGVVDYGTQPLPWIAMEYMNGGHLGERVGGMDTAQKLWTALAVTEGVSHAHNRGIAHRDLKPENILFRRVDGAWDAPKVADWGLSKHLLEHSKSRDGMTVEYAAPEQFSDSRSTDDRTDIYQLGAVFYELFTGQPPFEGEMFAVMEQIKTETPTPPSEIADVPDGLDEILLRALAKEPDDRYSDIVYLRDDLRDLFDRT